MTLFRRTHLPSPPPVAEDMPPRPQSPWPGECPRGAMVINGPRVPADDPTGAGPMTEEGEST